MNGDFSHRSSIIRLSALALLGLCFMQPTVHVAQTTRAAPASSSAGGQDSIWIDIGSPILGIAPGQTLRISALNPLAPPGGDGRKYKMLFAVTILDLDGRVVALSDEITLDPGEFHSFDFKRADLPLGGEPVTGRLQVLSLIRARFFPGIAARIPQGKLPVAVELIDDSNGKTVVLQPHSFQIISAGRNEPTQVR